MSTATQDAARPVEVGQRWAACRGAEPFTVVRREPAHGEDGLWVVALRRGTDAVIIREESLLKFWLRIEGPREGASR